MVPQQTGVLPIMRQQVQPAFRHADMQSQQPWIMAVQPASPLVQVTTQPSLVISHLHMPIIRLQLQTIIPFIMHVQEHIPPASIVHRFCIMARAMASSQEQVIFIPPWTFSNIILQRGTIIMVGAAGAVPIPGMAVVPIPGMPMPGIAIPVRSIIIVPVIILTPWVTKLPNERSNGLGRRTSPALPEKTRQIDCPRLSRSQTVLGFPTGNIT